MKFVYSLSLACALIATVSITGCGKNNDTTSTPASVVSSGVAPIPAPAGAGTIPTGCYYNGGATCAPCPQGYVQSGSFCTMSSAACPSGWNGYSCNQPSNIGCNTGVSWSWQNGGCITNNTANYPGYQCSPYGYAYICYYTAGAPSSGYYYNGYGWMRF